MVCSVNSSVLKSLDSKIGLCIYISIWCEEKAFVDCVRDLRYDLEGAAR